MSTGLQLSDAIPMIYRRLLDSVDELERSGRRTDAARYRAQAIRIYSSSWSESSGRRLTRIHEKVLELIQGC